jgi:hypothetical protein
MSRTWTICSSTRLVDEPALYIYITSHFLLVIFKKKSLRFHTKKTLYILCWREIPIEFFFYKICRCDFWMYTLTIGIIFIIFQFLLLKRINLKGQICKIWLFWQKKGLKLCNLSERTEPNELDRIAREL